MSKESVLNKEFANKDIQRLRNLIKGKYGEKSTIGVGYSKKDEIHNEGNIWEEGGRFWTIKDGIKQNVTKLDAAKKASLLPLFCPECKKIMKNRNDKSFYPIHKKCFNCVIEFETKLRAEGKWEEYKNKTHNDEIDNLIKECRLWLEDELKEQNESFITEAGDIENWLGSNNKDKLKQNIEESIKYLESIKK